MFLKGYPVAEAPRQHHTSTDAFCFPLGSGVLPLPLVYSLHVPLPGQKHHDVRLVWDVVVRCQSLVERML